MANHTILVVDDEKVQRDSLQGFLKKLGYRVQVAENGEKAIKEISRQTIDLVLSDFKMPGMTGFELLQAVREKNPSIMFVLMTAYGKIEDAVAALKAGAFDYLTKPVDLDELELIIKRALNFRHLKAENEILRQELQEKNRVSGIITRNRKMEEVLSIAVRAARSDASILIEGESGTGKELIARAIHYASYRKDKPLVTINCAALSENLLESELFGHEKGAFTGAVQQRTGRFEQADGGSVFLDEVGDIPLATQVKLLRFLQFGEFQRVGGNRTISVDVRLIAATNRNLPELINENKFREDFYFRLNVVNIHVPPLRERKEDIPLLTDHFIQSYSEKNGKEISGISREALDLLMQFPFNGNVRELENIIERAVVLARGETLTVDDLPLSVTNPSAVARGISPLDYYEGSFDERVARFEIDLIQRALNESGGNQSKAARSLGMGERHLRYKLQKYGLK